MFRDTCTFQTNLGSPFVPLPCSLQQVPKRSTTFERMLISSVSSGRKYQVGCLRKLTFLQWELEFKQSSFSHIGRVLRNPLGVTYQALFRFSLMLCSPCPFRGAFRAMVMVTRMTLLLLLTNKTLFWRWYKRPFHGAHFCATRGNLYSNR